MLGGYTNLEHNFIQCPILDTYLSPVVDTERIMLSIQHGDDSLGKFVEVSCYVRRTDDGEPYVDIYMYSPEHFETEIVRLIWKKGCKMSERDESDFIYITRTYNLRIDVQKFAEFQMDVADEFPDSNIQNPSLTNISIYLDNLYFTMFRSGVREILYKSNLDVIAFYLHEIEEYNMLGSSPTDIFDMPLNILRILNQKGLIDRLSTEASRRKVKSVYEEFSDYIDIGKGIPKRFQWTYLEEYRQFNNSGNAEFNKTIYKRLGKGIWTQMHYIKLKEYMITSAKLGELCPYGRIPKSYEVLEHCSRIKELESIMDISHYLDPEIEKNNHDIKYEYEDDEYVVTTPKTSYEIFVEGINQCNCVASFIDGVAKGETRIAFLRKKATPNKSYITMEIADGKVVQALARFNEWPSDEDVQFLEKYVKVKNLRLAIEREITWNQEINI